MARASVAVGLIALLLQVVACQKTLLEKEDAIRSLFTDYTETVDSVDDLMILIPWDAVLNPEGSPARVGKPAIRSFFEERSSHSSVQMRMDLVDTVLHRGWALAHTEDSWHVTRNASGISGSFDIRSLLVLRQYDHGEWMIAGHM